MSLYLAIGGGGDVIMAAALARGAPVGHIPWERAVVDPEPGPVRLEELAGAVRQSPRLARVGPHVRAARGGRTLRTQGACVAEVLGAEVYAVDAYAPPSEVARDLAAFRRVVGVDVGGDVLAEGCEEGLGSPLSDAYGLAVLAMLEEAGVEAELVVMSPGADGELDRRYIMERIATAAASGGLLGAVGLDGEALRTLERLSEACITEASRVAVRAWRGEVGRAYIRDGLRGVEVDACALVGFALRPSAVLRMNRAARIVYEGDLPIDQAASALLEAGIPTEYHLEELLKAGVPRREAVERLKAAKRCR